MNHWLVKSEPASYAWAQFAQEGAAAWTGVRNFQARLNLRAMARGDLALFYHSGAEKQVVGVARVNRPAYSDPTAEEGDWSAVDLVPVMPLTAPVSLAVIKADKALNEMLLVRNSRLSVMPVTEEQFARILNLAKTRL